jgi:hypothetical protein
MGHQLQAYIVTSHILPFWVKQERQSTFGWATCTLSGIKQNARIYVCADGQSIKPGP